MPGAKGGFPARLAEQMRDYFVIGLVLSGVALLGSAKNTAMAHGHGEMHQRLLATGRELTSAHHADPSLDLQVTLGICVMLISVTILFELLKHHLEHNVPPMMASILQVSSGAANPPCRACSMSTLLFRAHTHAQAMFGELTVLGFIALYAYFMLRLGVLSWFSMKIYHDPEHLIHLFEDIHFMLFFVMLTFLFQARTFRVHACTCNAP